MHITLMSFVALKLFPHDGHTYLLVLHFKKSGFYPLRNKTPINHTLFTFLYPVILSPNPASLDFTAFLSVLPCHCPVTRLSLLKNTILNSLGMPLIVFPESGSFSPKSQFFKLSSYYIGFFCTLGIRIFHEFAISYQISLVEQNGNSGVTQTSERTTTYTFTLRAYIPSPRQS